MIWQRLAQLGVLGMNRRNSALIARWNPRRLYPTVDDKIQTKRLCDEATIPTPRLLGVVRHNFELRGLAALVAPHPSFVMKPAHGAMGNGILVIRERDGDRFARSGGRPLDLGDLSFHASEILSGLYALGGQPDIAILEERLEVHPALADVSSGGVPDIRMIVYRGVPTMAMIRLPTEASRGRANLHQGALGAGVDLRTGRTSAAIVRNRPVEDHPDTGKPVLGFPIPLFDRAVEISVRAAGVTGLGYLGVDLVVDVDRGPVVLELNARPGLSIQLANQAGILPRLAWIERHRRDDMDVAERIELGMEAAKAS